MSERRQQTQRRRADERRRRSRRRKNDQRAFVIELTRTDLRIAQLDKAATGGLDQVSAWVVPWRVQAVGLQSAEGLSELTAAFREAAKQHAMSGAELRLVLSGEFCIMRIIRGTVEEVRTELGRLEQRSRLYLSLGPGEKVLVNHTRALDARHAHAVAAACNRATLETIQAAADAAGLEIAAIEPALSALSRAVSRLPDVPVEPYLLVHLDQATTEIGVCHERRLMLDYRPGGSTKVDDVPALLESHLNRLNRHVGRHVRTAAGGLRQVFLCGDDEAVDAAVKQFKRHPLFEVRRVRPADVQATWQFRDDAAALLTAPALGGLLASYLPEEELDAPNLMEHLFERQQEPLRPRLLHSALPLAATVLVAMALAVVNGRQQRALDEMQLERDDLAAVEARATELRLQLVGSEAKLEQLQALAARLPIGLGDDVIRRCGQCLPSDVWLTQLEITDRNAAQINGASFLESGVYDYVKWLQQAPGVAEVALRRTQPAAGISGPTTNFELELTFGESRQPATQVAHHE